MLFVDDIRHIIRCGIASGYVKNEKTFFNPILLGNPEIGKTSILQSFEFRKLKQVFAFTDLTKTKIQKFFKEMSNPHPVRYLVIPDFTMLLSHSQATEKGLIGILNSGIEEGLREVTIYTGGGSQETITFKEPLRFGIATSATRQFIRDRRRSGRWATIGFWSRLTPVSFSYTKEQSDKIREHIAAGRDIADEPEILKLKPMKVQCSKKYVQHFNKHIDSLIEATSLYGFRYTKQFRILLKANALLRGSKKVTQSDVRAIEKLTRWINMDYNPVENGTQGFKPRGAGITQTKNVNDSKEKE